MRRLRVRISGGSSGRALDPPLSIRVGAINNCKPLTTYCQMKSFRAFLCLLTVWFYQQQAAVHGFSSSSAAATRKSTHPSTRIQQQPRRIQEQLQRHRMTNNNDMDMQTMLKEEAKEVKACSLLVIETVSRLVDEIEAQDIVRVCDALDELQIDNRLWTSKVFQLRKKALENRRYDWLVKLLQKDYEAYVATASFLSPSRIPRRELPNVQDVPLAKGEPVGSKQFSLDGQLVVEDCQLQNMEYNDNLLDKLLLRIFRNLVTKNTGGVTSERAGILGLVDQARTFLLQPGQTPEAQHKMVRDTLAGLMTPVLPPFYRIFMAGIVPGTDTQLGPWFYAPYLTSFVTPTFFGFLVGPSYPNRRKDGQLGGLVVEKCKFLQESGCKGLCLHQCKLPAQQFFQDELGLALTVSPNFVTQECQWSFGETPLPPAEDPAFPQGCLAGCESRKAIAASGSKADVCN